ncbi:MAG: adenosylcobinamide-GDP ribazoletransferase [Vicingus serpentipes]|nr:adenosylcobinamide-GDP ribazoletransferase [Vicingus serpentipes]
MKEEVKIFLTALMFYTRIPCPIWIDHSEEYLEKSTRYLSLVGWIVGGITSFVFIISSFLFSTTLSIIFSITTSVLTTGAFHEDGLADTCDAFGGGWTKEKILTIMKDSRIGTYGVVALILMFLAKFSILSNLLNLHENNLLKIVAIFISGNSTSRFIAITSTITHSYVSDIDMSKSKLIVKKNFKWTDSTIIIAAFFGLIPLILFQSPIVFILIIPMYLIKWLMLRFFNRWIGGYTGDCLGAIQQISEVTFYIGLLLLWKFI